MNAPSNAIRFVLNDEELTLSEIAPTETLLDFLRLRQRLTGTKEGCNEGDCGACTVLVGQLRDGALVYESINACIRFVASLQGTHVVTIEHLARNGTLHPVQQALIDQHGSQCGFCTPGIVMSLVALWLSRQGAQPTRMQVEQALQGNLCRCTGYESIVRAMEQAARAKPEPGVATLVTDQPRIAAALRAIAATTSDIVIEHRGARAFVPISGESLAATLARHSDATIIAGATDVALWVTKQMRRLNPVVFVNRIAELQTIDVTPDGIRFGAGVSYSRAWPIVARDLPKLAELFSRIGGDQVRNAGTIGGNIANGSPIGDMPPPLMALGAELTLRSAAGRRTVPLQDYFIAYGRQDRLPGEFVESLFIPKLDPQAAFAVYKVSKRRDEDISAVCGAFCLSLGPGRLVEQVRIAFGGMAATPRRAAAVEARLIGRVWNEQTVEDARAEFDRDFSPISDWRASASYRARVAKNLLLRFYLETSAQEALLRRHVVAGARHV